MLYNETARPGHGSGPEHTGAERIDSTTVRAQREDHAIDRGLARLVVGSRSSSKPWLAYRSRCAVPVDRLRLAERLVGVAHLPWRSVRESGYGKRRKRQQGGIAMGMPCWPHTQETPRGGLRENSAEG